MFIFSVILIVLLVLVVSYIRNKNRFESQKPWQHFYDELQFSSKEFFNQVEEGVNRRKVPEVDFAIETFLETHIFSSRREYLRISLGEFVFFICAAPYGTGTFVSEWLCVKREGFFNTIPFLSKLMGKDRKDKTFYQIDTEAMFRSIIHSTVIETLEAITSSKGIRGLSETEKLIKESN